jgi:hypothetical protein
MLPPLRAEGPRVAETSAVGPVVRTAILLAWAGATTDEIGLLVLSVASNNSRSLEAILDAEAELSGRASDALHGSAIEGLRRAWDVGFRWLCGWE